MSDGPHKSLSKPPAWKELSKRANQRAYRDEDVANAVAPALLADWRAEGCPPLMRQMLSILHEKTQGVLFGDQLASDLEVLRNKVIGRSMPQFLLDATIHKLQSGSSSMDALLNAVKETLFQR